MTTINPADCQPSEVYEGTANGHRWTMQRVDIGDGLPWFCSRYAPDRAQCHDLTWADDSDVSSLVRLAPARKFTRLDLPLIVDVLGENADSKQAMGAAKYRVAAVTYLNDHPPKKQSWGGARISLELAEVQRDRDKWRERAEAAEARTAVTREDVEAAVHGVYAEHGNWAIADELTDAVCALFGVEAGSADQVEPEGDVIVRDAHDRMWWVTDDGWTNGTSRLDHDWADVPKPIRVTYRAESEAKR